MEWRKLDIHQLERRNDVSENPIKTIFKIFREAQYKTQEISQPAAHFSNLAVI